MTRRQAAALDAECIGVWGRRGSGKSTWVKRFVADRRRVLTFDPMDEYGGSGFRTFTSMRQLARYVLAHWSGFRAAYVPHAGAEPAELSALSWWLRDVQFEAEGQGARFERITFVVEELNLSFRLQGEARCTGFADLCSRGRHRDIEMIGVSQRLPEVARRFRDACSQHVVFCQARSKAADAALEIDAEPADVLALEPLEFLHANRGKVAKGRLELGRARPRKKS